MRIEIQQHPSEKVTLPYQVKITERLETSDDFHTIDRVITSPEFSTFQDAQNWLIKYLSQ